MTISLDKTVREIAVEVPASVQVFETLGIDYCCGGRKSLEQACSDLHLATPEVLQKLQKVTEERSETDDGQWHSASLADLTQYIVRKHHSFVRQQGTRLEALAQKVRDKHGAKYPELARIADLFRALRDELSMHMSKEEQVLFPYITRLEHAVQSGQPAPHSPFGTVANPIQVMTDEHDDAGSLLGAIRRASNDYLPPVDACPSYYAFYDGLKAFERDMHYHIHLENNILFPRALALEENSRR